MPAPRFLPICIVVLSLPLHAETVKDRAGAVRDDRTAMENDARWIYNDFERGFGEAKRTGKPLLVVLRCVPCLACAGIDAQVLLQSSSLAPLLDKFVCVRLINANTLDLSLFQFDYDLSFASMFFNGDRTVYGRYGSWTHQKNAQDTTTAGYQRALEAVLAIHQGYPGNKATLGGKQGAPTQFKTPLEIPELTGKYHRDLDWHGKVVQSCVHCHQIGDAYQSWYREQRKPIPDEWIFPWPAPETIGLTLAPDHIARVQAVAAGSPASQASLQAGDDIVSLDGQPLASVADMSWVLHRAPASASLKTVAKRKGTEQSLNLVLPAGWRTKTDTSKRVSGWQMRGMATGGLLLEDLADDERKRRRLSNDQLALAVKMVGQYGKHAAAKNAGFQKDDVIVQIDSLSSRMTESELFGHLLQKRFPGEKVKVVVLRGDQRIDLAMPMQ